MKQRTRDSKQGEQNQNSETLLKHAGVSPRGSEQEQNQCQKNRVMAGTHSLWRHTIEIVVGRLQAERAGGARPRWRRSPATALSRQSRCSPRQRCGRSSTALPGTTRLVARHPRRSCARDVPALRVGRDLRAGARRTQVQAGVDRCFPFARRCGLPEASVSPLPVRLSLTPSSVDRLSSARSSTFGTKRL